MYSSIFLLQDIVYKMEIIRTFIKIYWETDLQIGIGNNFEIGIGKWEIALKIVKWNANWGHISFVIIILFLYSNDTCLWKTIIAVILKVNTLRMEEKNVT